MRKKESIYIWRRGWLQRSNEIKEGFAGGFCVHGGISVRPKVKGHVSRLTCCTFLLLVVSTTEQGLAFAGEFQVREDPTEVDNCNIRVVLFSAKFTTSSWELKRQTKSGGFILQAK